MSCAAGYKTMKLKVGASYTRARKCLDVVKRDLSFKTRIRSSPNSSGLRFSGGVLDFDVRAIQRHPWTHGDPPDLLRFFGARMDATGLCFDPEVSKKKKLGGVSGTTHTSNRAMLWPFDHVQEGILKR